MEVKNPDSQHLIEHSQSNLTQNLMRSDQETIELSFRKAFGTVVKIVQVFGGVEE